LLTLVVVPVLYSYLVRDRAPRPSENPAGQPAALTPPLIGANGAGPLPMPADRD